MNIKKYIRKEYKGWLIAIFLFLILLGFGKSFEYIKSIAELNSIFKIGQIILILAFGLSFVFYVIYASGLEHNSELEFREHEPEDVERLKRNLKKMLTIFSVSSVLWIIGNLIIGIEYGNAENLKYFIAIISLPLIINGIMIYIKNGIKTACNNV
jgi:lipopolysaccharide export LptBFGC system permease protein LptF